MRHSAARRVALALCALLLGAALLFAWSISSAPAARPAGDPGAAAEDPYGAYCGACHELEDLTGPFVGDGAAAAVLELLDFLEDHGAASAAEDRAIAAHLLEAARAAR